MNNYCMKRLQKEYRKESMGQKRSSLGSSVKKKVKNIEYVEPMHHMNSFRRQYQEECHIVNTLVVFRYASTR